MQTPIYPPIRTFHARHGRLSASRLHLLENVVPTLDIASLNAPVKLREIFPNRKTVVDFGAGMGHHTQDLATQGYGVLAIDVHTPGICRIAEFVSNDKLDNVRVHLGDGIPILETILEPGCVDELHVMFPDPWPKARHNKRRVIQHSLFELADRVLAADGSITMITDDDDYAVHIATTLDESPLFELVSNEANIPATSYKRRADHMKNSIHGFIAKRR